MVTEMGNVKHPFPRWNQSAKGCRILMRTTFDVSPLVVQTAQMCGRLISTGIESYDTVTCYSLHGLGG